MDVPQDLNHINTKDYGDGEEGPVMDLVTGIDLYV